jgi:hypothetical protein
MNTLTEEPDGFRLLYRLPKNMPTYTPLTDYLFAQAQLPAAERTPVQVKTSSGTLPMTVAGIDDGERRFWFVHFQYARDGSEGASATMTPPADPDVADEIEPVPKRHRGPADPDVADEIEPVPKRHRSPAAAAGLPFELVLDEIAGIVYVLRIEVCGEIFRYVGCSGRFDTLPPVRLLEHTQSLAAGCGKLLPPDAKRCDVHMVVERFETVTVVPGVAPVQTMNDVEHRETLRLMQAHGTRNVRGGVFCQSCYGSQLATAQLALFRSCTNRCYRTGRPLG